MILVVGGIKGGSGKTTIATNLVVIRALAGRKVLFVDADEQRSAADWVEQREALGISTPWTTIPLYGHAVRSQVLKMASDYDEVIIDTGGRDTTSQRAALSIADVLLTPFQPRSFDVWTLGRLKALIEDVRSVNEKLQVLAVLSRADAQGGDNEEAKDILSGNEGITCLDAPLVQRKAFSSAAAEGLGVVELKRPDPKASREIEALHDAVFSLLAMSK